MALLAFTIVGVALVLFAIILRFNSSGQKFAKIPGPKAWPLIGNMFELVITNEELFKFVRYMYREFGDIVRLWSFNKKVINIFRPEDVEIVLSTTKFNQKDEPYVLLKPWLCEGLLISNGSKWQHRRKLLTPAFHFNILKQFTKVFNDKTEEFVDRLQKEVDAERTDPHPYINKMTLSTMCETSMGTCLNASYDGTREKYFEAITTLGQCIILRLTRLWLQVEWLFKLTPYNTRQKKALNDVHTFTNNIISDRRSQKIDTKHLIDNFDEDATKKITLAMLDLLLEYEKQGKIDNEGIREEVDTFMFEGHDTTAMALFFMTVRLANEPEIQDKIYEELYTIFGDSDRPSTTNDLYEMKYLELCIKESLRLYPSVPFIARKLNEEVTLSGYKIPAQTICAIHIYDVHRRADVYPDPERFIPERFLPENVNNRHPYAYIPFSAGPRNCIGQKFALLEMKTVMSRLLRRYKLEPVTKTKDMRFTVDLVLKPLFPFYVRFRNRITT